MHFILKLTLFKTQSRHTTAQTGRLAQHNNNIGFNALNYNIIPRNNQMVRG
jgi:hypothetical protein